MRIIRERDYAEMIMYNIKARDIINEDKIIISGLQEEITVLKEDLKEYKLRDFLSNLKKDLKKIPKDKFVSEILVGRIEMTLILHFFKTRGHEEILKTFGKVGKFTELRTDSRVEILLKSKEELEEYINEIPKGVNISIGELTFNDKEENEEIGE